MRMSSILFLYLACLAVPMFCSVTQRHIFEIDDFENKICVQTLHINLPKTILIPRRTEVDISLL